MSDDVAGGARRHQLRTHPACGAQARAMSPRREERIQ